MEDLSTVRSALEETVVNKMPMKTEEVSTKKSRKERSRGENEMHTAIRMRQIKKIAEMLDSGADINSVNLYNVTPLHYAMELGFDDAVELLLKRGAKTSKRIFHTGETPLMMGVAHPNCVKRFVDCCAKYKVPFDINQINYYGETIVHYCVATNNMESLQIVLNAGADINAEAHGGVTPLTVAVEENKRRMVRFLKEKGAIEKPEVEEEEPETNLPPFVQGGFLNETDCFQYEEAVGGALWSKAKLEYYITGKKLRTGLAVEIRVDFTPEFLQTSPVPFTKLWGIINHVSQDEKKIKATVFMMREHAAAFPTFADKEFEVTLEFNPGWNHPWELTSIAPQSDPEKALRVLEERETKYMQETGRKVPLSETPCQILKGMKHIDCVHDEPPLVITEVNFIPEEEVLTYKFEDGSEQEHEGPEVQMVFEVLAQQAELLRSTKVKTAIFRVNGQRIL